MINCDLSRQVERFADPDGHPIHPHTHRETVVGEVMKWKCDFHTATEGLKRKRTTSAWRFGDRKKAEVLLLHASGKRRCVRVCEAAREATSTGEGDELETVWL